MIREPYPEPTIVRSRKRKRTVALHVQSDGALRVLAPQRTSMKWIKEFINERSEWIADRRRSIKARQSSPALTLKDGSKLPFHGEEMTLRLNKTHHDELISSSYNSEERIFSINIPSQMDESVQEEEIKTELVLWYKKQARTLIPERVEHWAERTDLRPTKVIFNGAKQQWGSCNSKNEIRLNWRLILASPAIIDYIVVHELCHIPHKNHGPNFWSLCIKHLPETMKARQALKKWEKNHHPAHFP